MRTESHSQFALQAIFLNAPTRKRSSEQCVYHSGTLTISCDLGFRASRLVMIIISTGLYGHVRKLGGPIGAHVGPSELSWSKLHCCFVDDCKSCRMFMLLKHLPTACNNTTLNTNTMLSRRMLIYRWNQRDSFLWNHRKCDADTRWEERPTKLAKATNHEHSGRACRVCGLPKHWTWRSCKTLSPHWIPLSE